MELGIICSLARFASDQPASEMVHNVQSLPDLFTIHIRLISPLQEERI